jgi:hypothetical protein
MRDEQICPSALRVVPFGPIGSPRHSGMLEGRLWRRSTHDCHS